MLKTWVLFRSFVDLSAVAWRIFLKTTILVCLLLVSTDLLCSMHNHVEVYKQQRTYRTLGAIPAVVSYFCLFLQHIVHEIRVKLVE
jgi:hypothetical protein